MTEGGQHGGSSDNSSSSSSSDDREGSSSPNDRNRITESESSSVTSEVAASSSSSSASSSSSSSDNDKRMSMKQDCRGRNNPSPPCSGFSSSSGSGNDDDGYSRSGGEDGWEGGSAAGSEGWERDRDRDSGNSSSEQSHGARRRKRPLDAVEKAQVNRDRNREHARNTRLRKKAYVNKMEQLVQDLSASREQEEQAWQMHMMQVAEVERSRKHIAALFFQLYFSSDTDRSKWAEVVEESFSLTCPITPYRSFSRAEVVNNSRVLFGVDAVMTDALSLAVMVEGFGAGTPQWRRARMLGQQTRLVCTILPDDIITQGNMLMCRFNVRSEGAVQSGAMSDFSHIEMMQCKFSYGNKLLAVEIMFDVMGLLQQLQRVNGVSNVMPVVPNTVEMACQPSSEVRLVATVEPPFKIVYVNEQWAALCAHFSAISPVGEALNFMQGPATDMTGVLTLISNVQSGKPGCLLTTCYKKDGTPFINFIRIYPLSSSNDCGDALVTHFLVVMQEQPENDNSNNNNGITNTTTTTTAVTDNNTMIVDNSTADLIASTNNNSLNNNTIIDRNQLANRTHNHADPLTWSTSMPAIAATVMMGTGGSGDGSSVLTATDDIIRSARSGSNSGGGGSSSAAAVGFLCGSAVGAPHAAAVNLFGQQLQQPIAGNVLPLPLPGIPMLQRTDGAGVRGNSVDGGARSSGGGGGGGTSASMGEWWQQAVCCCGRCRFCLGRGVSGSGGWADSDRGLCNE